MLNYTSRTYVSKAESDNGQVIVIGLCIDSHGEIERDNVAASILSKYDSVNGKIETVYNYCDRFAGRFTVLIFGKDDIYVFGDVTSYMEMNYTFYNDKLYLSPYYEFIAKHLGFKPSSKGTRIKHSASYDEPFPNDVTLYNEIKVVLPDHYLSCKEKKTKRVPFKIDICKNEKEVNQVISDVYKKIVNVVKQYYEIYDIVCPLTGGADSRVAYMLCYEHNLNILSYTFGDDNNIDVKVARQITEIEHTEHKMITVEMLPAEYLNAVKKIVGTYQSDYLIALGYNFVKNFGYKAVINGDLIDHLGRSTFGNTVPPLFATPEYFASKFHNYSKEAKAELKKYLDGIPKENREQVYDMFSYEQRCARWASQGKGIYSCCGVTSINPWNCREMVLQWMRIPRKLRRDCIIHKYIYDQFKEKHPGIVALPINPDKKHKWMYDYWPSYYLGTMAKHKINKRRFKKSHPYVK